ncbi:MAG: hypothetical protein M4579_005896 [Chaenotheca gracillima]|nr:MAG: hypothetical protein M4579_005896 [Chaenotheca gracillima]
MSAPRRLRPGRADGDASEEAEVDIEVEILAHVSAPAGARDDKRYRALAAAHANFHKHAPKRIYGGCARISPVHEPHTLRADTEPSTKDGDGKEVSFNSITVTEYASSPTINVPNTTSTCARKRRGPWTEERERKRGERSRGIRLRLSSETETSPCVRTTDGLVPSSFEIQSSGRDMTRMSDGAKEYDPALPSVIADSQPSSSLASRRAPRSWRRSSITSRQTNGSSSTSRNMPSSPPLGISTINDLDSDSEHHIFPPTPTRSSNPFPISAPDLPPELHALTDSFTLERNFSRHILVQTRDILPFERGYWAFSVSAFACPATGKTEEGLSVEDSFWAYLGRSIGKGWAGWGVWGWRAGNDHGREVDEGRSGHADAGEDGRVYCWGAHVGHVWLLLLTASQRGIRDPGVRVRWVDATNTTVLEMKSIPDNTAWDSLGAVLFLLDPKRGWT